MKCTCPKCRGPVPITQALPAQVQCPACKASFRVNKPARKPVPVAQPAPGMAVPALLEPLAETESQAPVSNGRSRNLILVLCGVGAFLVGGILLLIVVLSSGKKDEPKPNPDNVPDFASSFDIPEPKLPVKPIDPRQEKIDKAIERGVAYLKKRLNDGDAFVYFINDKGGAHLGAMALTGLTLLECGHDAKDPAVQKAAQAVRAGAPTVSFTYGIALCMLFLNRLNESKDTKDARMDPVDLQLIQSMTLRLIAGQQKEGGWGYHCQMMDTKLEDHVRTELIAGRFRPGSISVPNQYFSPADNSIGQFATLALWAVRKHGVPVGPTLHECAAHYRRTLRPEGNWSYRPQSPFMKDTATCAGLIALAVQNGLQDDEQNKGSPASVNAPKEGKKGIDPAQDPLAIKALGHLERVIGKKADVSDKTRDTRFKHNVDFEALLKAFEAAPQGPAKQGVLNELIKLDRPDLLLGSIFEADAWGDLYFLWSLERMAVIYDLKTIGAKDWYTWGVDILLANQKAEGHWHDRFPGVPDTCFALLFLRRANLAKDLTDKFRLLRGESISNAPNPVPSAPSDKKGV